MRLAPEGSPFEPPRPRARLWAGLALLAAAVIAARALRAGEHLPELLRWARGTGWVGLLLLGLLYVPAALAMVPAALVTMAAGLVFGPLAAFLVAVPAGTLSSCAAFQVGRQLAGDPQFLARGEGRIARVARCLGGRKGFWAVFLLRLSPVTPFAVLNFAFGATPIRLRTFALATALGSLPSTLAYAWAPRLLGAALGLPR